MLSALRLKIFLFGKTKVSTKISIITVNRNNLQGLARTIESIKSQTFRNFEHIIIDGASTDGSLDLIQKRKESFSYWISEADNGIYDAMNKGIKRASGEYCIFLNSGDMFSGKKVLEKIFVKPLYADILYGDVILSYDNGRLERKSYPERLEKCFLAFETICHQTTIYLTKYIQEIGGYDLNYKICADYALLARSVYENKLIQHVSVFISVYDMTGTANDPKNSTLITKERSLIQSKYYTKEEIKLSLDTEPIYRDWLKWKSSRLLNFYDLWNSRLLKLNKLKEKFFSRNGIKQLSFSLISFAIKKLHLFDEEFYKEQLKLNNIDLPVGSDYLHHYIRHGYFACVDPFASFNGSLISKYYGLKSNRIKNPLIFLLLTLRFKSLFSKKALLSVVEIGKKKTVSNDWEDIVAEFKNFAHQTEDNTCHFIINHNMAGGALKALDLILEKHSFKGNHLLVSPSTEYKNLAGIEFRNRNKKMFFEQSDLTTLFSQLQKKSITFDIRINHLIGFDYLSEFLGSNLSFIREIYLHDYHFLCPFLFLSPSEVYCGLPTIKGCNDCLEKNGRSWMQIETYRAKYSFLFETEKIKIIAPSLSVIKHFKKIFPKGKYFVEPHEKILFPVERKIQKKKKGVIRIGILGHLTVHKGVALVNYFIQYIKDKNLKIKLICIGYSEPIISNSMFYEETGTYKDSELDGLIRNYALDLIWFPTRIPETYSFTLTSALLTGLPLYVPNIGAFPERIGKRKNAYMFSYSDDMRTISEKLVTWTKQIGSSN